MPHLEVSISIREEKAFQLVFEQLYPSLLFFARKNVPNPDEAEDFVQEAFIKLWDLRTDFSYLHQIQAFLYSCIKNRIINNFQHQKVVERYRTESEHKPTDQSDMSDCMIQTETYRLFIDALEQLPPKMRQVMHGYLDGKTPEAIAQELQISVETVYSQKQLAIKRLQAMLGRYFTLLVLFSHIFK